LAVERRFEWPARFVLTKSDFDSLQPADAALPDHFNGQPKPLVTSLPRSDLHDPVRLFDDVADNLPFVHSQRQRFFAIHILSGPAGVHEHLCVPMIGSTDRDDIDILPRQELTVILINGGRTAEAGARLLSDMLIHVTDSDDVAVFTRLHRDDGALVAHADAADAERLGATRRLSRVGMRFSKAGSDRHTRRDCAGRQ
jgi:hypothetical protein